MRHRLRRHAPVLVAGALASALLGGCSDPAPTGEAVPGVRAGVTLPAPADRDPAPVDIEVPVVGGDGETLSLGDLAGEVVVLNFWGSWCGPCRAEQPELNQAAADLRDAPVRFLGVNVADSEANALAHEREFAIPYPSVFDPASAYASEFGSVGPRSIPTTIVVDHEGRVAARLFGITDLVEVTALARRVADEVPTG